MGNKKEKLKLKISLLEDRYLTVLCSQSTLRGEDQGDESLGLRRAFKIVNNLLA